MCRALSQGGRRCPHHSPEARRTGRAAARIYGADNPITRAAVEALPTSYVHGTIEDRARIAATSTNEAVLKLAARDPKPAVVDALATNPVAEEIRLLKPAHVDGEEVVKQEPAITTLADTLPLEEHAKRPSLDDLDEAQRAALTAKSKDDRFGALNRYAEHGAGTPIPDELLDDRSYEIRRLVASRTNDPVQLERLSQDADLRVRQTVLSNGAAPDEALQHMADRGDAEARDSLDKNARRRGEEPPPLSAIEQERIDNAVKAKERERIERAEKQAVADATLTRRRPLLDIANKKTATADEIAAAFSHPEADASVKAAVARHNRATPEMRLATLDDQTTSLDLIHWARYTRSLELLEALGKHANREVREEAKHTREYLATR